MKRTRKRAWFSCLALVATAALAGCGGGDIKNTNTAGGAQDCDTFDMAVNPWVGYEANAHVVGQLATTQLGCDVNYVDLDEQTSWKGFGTGDVDIVIENWGHPELKAKYMKSAGGNGDAVEAGQTGIDGVIGWYVPPWMAEKYPDITDWKNLNKYSDLFKTTESGDQGQLLDGDPGYVTYDEALVKNLDLNYKVVVGGSEAALIEAFRTAETNKTPLLAYFYHPQYLFNEMDLVKIDLPPYRPECYSDVSKIDCDYPPYHLDKIVSSDFSESGSPALDLVKSFQWTEEDQNTVATYIAEDGMDPDDAADKWIADNQDKVDAWLGS
ncbi:MAG: ABC transporter substrate-binding protein [Propionibacteriales bacterium]|nr:ABC transporter substrate-binding protein [Propionibacteriales bacterium]